MGGLGGLGGTLEMGEFERYPGNGCFRGTWKWMVLGVPWKWMFWEVA